MPRRKKARCFLRLSSVWQAGGRWPERPKLLISLQQKGRSNRRRIVPTCYANCSHMPTQKPAKTPIIQVNAKGRPVSKTISRPKTLLAVNIHWIEFSATAGPGWIEQQSQLKKTRNMTDKEGQRWEENGIMWLQTLKMAITFSLEYQVQKPIIKHIL